MSCYIHNHPQPSFVAKPRLYSTQYTRFWSLCFLLQNLLSLFSVARMMQPFYISQVSYLDLSENRKPPNNFWPSKNKDIWLYDQNPVFSGKPWKMIVIQKKNSMAKGFWTMAWRCPKLDETMDLDARLSPAYIKRQEPSLQATAMGKACAARTPRPSNEVSAELGRWFMD